MQTQLSTHFSESKWVNVEGSTFRKNKFNKLQLNNDILRTKGTIFRSILDQRLITESHMSLLYSELQN